MKKVLKHTMSAAAAGGLLLVLYAMKELFPFGEFTVSWCDMNPVSYTHLDVYKRQPMRGAAR